MNKTFLKKLLIFGLALAMLYGISRCYTAPERQYTQYGFVDGVSITQFG